MSRGIFVVLEGIEGVGKSTQLSKLREYFDRQQIEHIATREPGGTPMAERIRDVFLAHEDEESISPWTELLLVFAARAQHLTEKIYPAIESGKWVLSDRFTDASYAYQGSGRALGCDKVAALESLVQGTFRPDLVVVLDMPVEKALSRVKLRPEKKDRMDAQSVRFYQAVQAAYHQRASQYPDRYVILDASKTPEQTHAEICAALEYRFSSLLSQVRA